MKNSITASPVYSAIPSRTSRSLLCVGNFFMLVIFLRIISPTLCSIILGVREQLLHLLTQEIVVAGGGDALVVVVVGFVTLLLHFEALRAGNYLKVCLRLVLHNLSVNALWCVGHTFSRIKFRQKLVTSFFSSFAFRTTAFFCSFVIRMYNDTLRFSSLGNFLGILSKVSYYTFFY
jgi:hypothetical protein